jgi:hypothetical protein
VTRVTTSETVAETTATVCRSSFCTPSPSSVTTRLILHQSCRVVVHVVLIAKNTRVLERGLPNKNTNMIRPKKNWKSHVPKNAGLMAFLSLCNLLLKVLDTKLTIKKPTSMLSYPMELFAYCQIRRKVLPNVIGC